MRHTIRTGAGVLAAIMLVALGPVTAGPALASRFAPGPEDAPAIRWVWPVASPFRIAERFVAPAHDYAPGHRGIDIQPLGGEEVRAPAAGVVAFSGDVAGRGIVTIDHGDGLVTTLEPVLADVPAGTSVLQADSVGSVSLGGHAPAGTVHFGVRLEGRYINPMLLLGGVPRAVLLPCCAPL